jgi:hypothetical protein
LAAWAEVWTAKAARTMLRTDFAKLAGSAEINKSAAMQY